MLGSKAHDSLAKPPYYQRWSIASRAVRYIALVIVQTVLVVTTAGELTRVEARKLRLD